MTGGLRLPNMLPSNSHRWREAQAMVTFLTWIVARFNSWSKPTQPARRGLKFHSTVPVSVNHRTCTPISTSKLRSTTRATLTVTGQPRSTVQHVTSYLDRKEVLARKGILLSLGEYLVGPRTICIARKEVMTVTGLPLSSARHLEEARTTSFVRKNVGPERPTTFSGGDLVDT